MSVACAEESICAVGRGWGGRIAGGHRASLQTSERKYAFRVKNRSNWEFPVQRLLVSNCNYLFFNY